MRSARIGSLEVSVIGLGCNNFGRALDAAGSALVVEAALEAGIDFFDTASNYGDGQSESFLAQALGSRRDEVVIATKFGVPVPGWPDSGGAQPGYVRRAIERSLRELGTDRIDLYMLHFPDPLTPIEDTLETMNQLVEEGKALEIGCSNFDPAQLGEALDASARGDLASFVCDQAEYSLVHRDPETSGLADMCIETGVALIPFYPLASGLLTGKTRRGRPPQGRLQMERYQSFLTDENFDLVEALDLYARERDLSMAQVALGWLLAQEAVPAVTVGATTPEQVAVNATGAAWSPNEDDLAALREITGG
jgi:aryl-alcohol dehydrogenase-like predicted oxidoreductase